MSLYTETEIKVLGIDIAKICSKLDSLGAKKVFDDDRVFVTFDYPDLRLSKNKNEVRLTTEGTFKLSFEDKIENTAIKLKVSRDIETIDFLAKLDLHPVAKVKSHRMSYEWEGVDFDIDSFPDIPSFIEIDIEQKGHTIDEILKLLDLSENEVVTISTKEVYKKYGIDYYEKFKV